MFVRRRIRRVTRRRRRFLFLTAVIALFAIIAIPLAALAESPSALHDATPTPTSDDMSDMPGMDTGDTAIPTVQAQGPESMGGMDMTAEGTPTADQQAAADKLLADTKAGTTRFEDFSVAQAEGYTQATPFMTASGVPMAHFVNKQYMLDGDVLDPTKPEALMYLKTTDGDMILAGVMYTAAIGTGPTPGGPLTMWHTHPDLCLGALTSDTGDRKVAHASNGACPSGTATLPFEMMHVWLVPNSDGPFAHSAPSKDDLINGGIVTADQLPSIRERLRGRGSSQGTGDEDTSATPTT